MESPEAQTAASFPDWQTISEPIHCPLCEYDLRGLSAPRCPECGYEFRWEDLLDRKRRRHEYLFEHHPQKNLKSFVRTLVGGLAPWRFWKDLQAAQRPDLRRLWQYRSTLTLITWLPFAGALLYSLFAFRDRPRSAPAAGWLYMSPFSLVGNLTTGKANYATVLLELTYRTTTGRFIVLMTFVLLSLPALTALPLSVFQSTLREAKIQHHHVQRCIIYSFDIVVWPAMLIFVLTLGVAGYALFDPGLPTLYAIIQEVLLWCILLMLPLVLLIMGVRLAFACKHYLRLKHAWAVAAATQAIGALLVLVLIVLVGQMVTRW